MNNQAAWWVLTKWLKHSSKHSNETVDKKRLIWHANSNHRTVILNVHLTEMPNMSNMSELDKWTLFYEWELLVSSILELKFFIILLSLRDTRGDRMCGNEIKQRMLTSPGIYKHCNPMYPAICSYDEEAIDKISEEIEKKKLSLRNRCGPFQVNAWLSRPKKHGGFRPQWGYPGNLLRPRERSGRGSPDEGYN